ncbi:MAG: family 10 glycosylhydrolase [Bacteroidota bacterium]
MLPRLLSLLLLASFFLSLSMAQTYGPKREFRGAWIATVKNIDWPSRAGLSTAAQQEEAIELLDELKAAGLNAVIFQVRPATDAFYASRFEPWSEWLMGEQGKGPQPFYDPLEFFIEESHKRGMEFHAWFNPYRAAVDYDSLKPLAPNHITRLRPQWFVQYGKNLYFDPGVPEGRDYVIQVISDVLRRYDLDGIHFDDYFYPYKISGQEFPDDASYAQFGYRYPNRDNWRRNNVDEFIRIMRDSLLTIKPSVKFGISPFGVWRNQSMDPTYGSNTRAGQTSYDDLYADILKWLREGWIDYVAPQIYWSIGYPPAAFDILVEWWRDHTYGKHLYIGQAPYKVANNADPNWDDPKQLPLQIRMIREAPEADGSIFFSAKWFKQNPLGFADSLRNNLYYFPALPPRYDWIDPQVPPRPSGIETDQDPQGIAMRWTPESRAEDLSFYAVYKGQGKNYPVATPQFLVAVLPANQPYFLDEDTRFLRKYHYVITALDKNYNESGVSEMRSQRSWKGLFGKKKKQAQ